MTETIPVELIEAVRAGGVAERDALVEAVWPDAYRIAYAMLRDGPAAEDAAQEACIVVCRSIRALRSAAAFRVWFYRIVVREASAARRRGARPRVEAIDEAVHPNEADAIDVWRALASLPQHLRDVVLLRYFEDLTSRDIARVLRIPDGTVRFRLAVAKRRLRPLLDDAPPTEHDSSGEVRSLAI